MWFFLETIQAKILFKEIFPRVSLGPEDVPPRIPKSNYELFFDTLALLQYFILVFLANLF